MTAVFAVACDSHGGYFSTVLRNSSSNLPENLEYLCDRFATVADQLRLTDKVKAFDEKTIDRLFNAVEDITCGDFFKDDLINVEGVNYSSIYHPDTGNLEIFNGKFEDLIETHEMPMDE